MSFKPRRSLFTNEEKNGPKPNYYPKSAKEKEESQLQRQDQNDAVEAALGFPTLLGQERLGCLVNMATVPKMKDETTKVMLSAVDCYFVCMNSTMFKVRIPFSPYFYVQAKEDMLIEVEGALLKKFEGTVKSVDKIYKQDLGLRNHLTGLQRHLLRLSFNTVSNLQEVKKELQKVIMANTTRKGTSGGAARHNGNKDPWQAIEDLREYDVPYHQRFSIDKRVNCGCWYTVSAKGGQTTLHRHHDMVFKMEPRICAFDIETTKLPMRFPNPEIDQIFMISYMLDRQGFLITNREFVSKDIDPFEYTPKPEFKGPFCVFNEKDEVAVLRRWFDHMRKVQPTVYVTYNGDFFDWPFIEKRAEKHGMNMKEEIGFQMNYRTNECLSKCSPHLDCLHWVNRDSYLPQGSRGLKNVTKAKLGYKPVEVDPEKMLDMARMEPQAMASYSVSDAVATYYLYMTYIHPFVFSLATIIPMPPDEVLRKGSGTLCESLLMVKAFENNIVFPNKHASDGIKFHKGKIIDSETYIGGKVEGCESGVFRADLPLKFRCTPGHYQRLIDRLDSDLTYALTVEGKKSMEDVVNYAEVKGEIQSILESLRDQPNRQECPLIYHLDVAAMYPNIILTNRLQPTATVTSEDCAACDFNKPGKTCLRNMNWVWRGEYFPASRDEYRIVESRVRTEKFTGQNGVDRYWDDLSAQEKTKHVKERLKQYCKTTYGLRKDKPVTEVRDVGICMRENSFYVDTVQEFRDRRYEYKGLTKKWKGAKAAASQNGDKAKMSEAGDMIVVYDSLQLAHKCILNSFYGYVMRKGARWFSMEMAGVVTHTGANIIERAHELIKGLGRPLELDTDGIWCTLPKSFPEDFKFKCADGKDYKISYPCVILNTMVAEHYKNEQYQTLVDPGKQTYKTSTAMSIEFELDGPYKAMILPASQEEGKSIKKRYAVFNFDGSLAELKGFEVKRRGELQLIKAFQSDVFREFLKGGTLKECYASVARVADRYIDIVEAKGWTLSDEEVLQFISESCTMSRAMDEYEGRKSNAMTCAVRLSEFLQDERLKQKGLTAKYIISQLPEGKSTTERAIPIQIFGTSPAVAQKFLNKWCGRQALSENPDVIPDMRNIIDWAYYRERLCNSIQKIITIPAELQGVENPVPRVAHPEWLNRQINERRFKQKTITSMWPAREKSSEATKNVMDIEDVGGQPPVIEIDNGDFMEDVQDRMEVDAENNQANGNLDKGSGGANAVSVDEEPVEVDREYGAKTFIRRSKRTWRAALKARRTKRSLRSMEPTSMTSIFETPSDDRPTEQIVNMDQFLRREQGAVTNSLLWQIVQIAETPTPGGMKVWALAGSRLFDFPLIIPKTFYISMDTQLEGRISIRKHPPPGVDAFHVYQESCTQQEYNEKIRGMSVERAHLKEIVHEDRLPDWLSAAISIGGLVSLAHHARGKSYNQGLSLTDLQMEGSTRGKYIDASGPYGLGPLHPIIIVHNMSLEDKRAIVAVVSPASRSGELVVVNPNAELDQNKRSSTVQALWQEYVSEMSEDGRDVWNGMQDVDFVVHVVGRRKDAWHEVNRAIRGVKGFGGPAMALVTSPLALKALQQEVPILCEIPCCDLPSGRSSRDIQSAYENPRWRVSVTEAVFKQCVSAGAGLQQRMEQAKYCELPLGFTSGGNWMQAAADVMYARSLRETDHLLWAVDSDMPSMAVHAAIDSEEYYKDDPEKAEIIYPGVYRTVCVELRVFHMEVVAAVNAGLLYEAEGTMGSKWIRMMSSLTRRWAADAGEMRNRAATGLVKSFYQWVSDRRSKTYHPELKRQVDQLVVSMLRQLVAEMEKLEVTVVKADCTSIIIATGKRDPESAAAYLDCILQTLAEKELFVWLEMKPAKMWHTLLFRDNFNYHGIEVVDGAPPDAKPQVKFHWNLKEYLPKILQKAFVNTVAEFLVRPELKLRKSKEHNLSQGLSQSAQTKASECAVVELLKEELRTHFVSSLYGAISRLQNLDEELEEFTAFPVLPGSYLSQEELGSVPLAFLRTVIHVMGLDASVQEEVEELNRNLLKLLDLDEFSPQATFRDPCFAVIIRDVICRECGSCSDLDCCRETELSNGIWACKSCMAPFDKDYIQKRLISDLQQENMKFQMQTLKCSSSKCWRTARSYLQPYCPDCCSAWAPSRNPADFRRKVLGIRSVAECNGFEAIMQISDRLLGD
ncbi:hypothetical protein BSKO_10263 [Bryopsis sp. KO-2023]|nr:hypothetical protein BSKO_10263 [Bryopsis sp. KO-2023]